MSELLPGLIVERMIPPDVWVGLMTGRYDLFGAWRKDYKIILDTLVRPLGD